MMLVMAETGPVWSIVEALGQILLAIQQILTAIGSVVFTSPVLPLLCWTGFWLFAVDWTRLRQIILGGGWMGVLLIGVVMVIVWQQISPSTRAVFGLTELSGYIEKLVYVTALLSLMFVCGAVQLTGCCSRCLPGVSTSPEPDDSGAA